jgi:hypothetical protein
MFATFGNVLPGNASLSIVQSGSWGNTLLDVVTNANNFGANQYWADFNNITTGAVAAPGPMPGEGWFNFAAVAVLMILAARHRGLIV